MKKTFTRFENSKVAFDVVVDDLFINIPDLALTHGSQKKAILSLVNSFESGGWRTSKFEAFIWDNIKETALSASERESLIGEEHSSLQKSASNLRFTHNDEYNNGGEIGEILLYGIMKKYYNALPIVPKVFYKQSSGDFAKGADSVHLVIDDENQFSFWLGEAKFYKSLESSMIDKCVNSVKNLLQKDKLRKEFNIVTSLTELDNLVSNKTLVKEIKEHLGDGVSLDEIKRQKRFY